MSLTVHNVTKKIKIRHLEAVVKRRITRALERIDGCWYFMPVQTGFGVSVLDYIVCINGRFIVIETKREDGKLTPRQHETACELRDAGAFVYVVRGVEEAESWIADVLPKLVKGDLRGAINHPTFYRKEEFYNLRRETSDE